MLNYSELDLRVGLECHQQLDTGKLFCRCPSKNKEDYENYDFKVIRKLRPVASETNEFDKAALEEFKKNKEYFYIYDRNYSCLLDLDEEPPRDLNKDALKAVLEVALKSNAEIFPLIYVMRKMVIDGSNTSGFQRTMLIAKDGYISLKNKKVRIESIALEEDSAKVIERSFDKTVYSLDRLGIPLIELTTAPEAKSPEEAKELASRIGELFRITGYARRGLGSIRQDLNISIKDGARVEIKGVQDLKNIDLFVKNEVLRQKNLIALRDKIKVPEKKSVLEITDIFENTRCKFIKESLNKKRVFAMLFKDMKGVFGFELHKGFRFGTELASYLKVKANINGLLHSDELPAYGISKEEVLEVKKRLMAKENDAFVIIIENDEKVFDYLLERMKDLKEKIPSETRQPKESYSVYARPMPGAARMYPETDIAPMEISQDYLNALKKDLPLFYEERISLFSKYINKHYSSIIAKHNLAREFRALLNKYDAVKMAELLMYIDRPYKIEDFAFLLNSSIDRKNYKEAVKLYMENVDKESILKRFLKDSLSDKAKNLIRSLLKEKSSFIKERGLSSLKALMGLAIASLKKNNMNVDAKELSLFLREEIKKYL